MPSGSYHDTINWIHKEDECLNGSAQEAKLTVLISWKYIRILKLKHGSGNFLVIIKIVKRFKKLYMLWFKIYLLEQADQTSGLKGKYYSQAVYFKIWKKNWLFTYWRLSSLRLLRHFQFLLLILIKGIYHHYMLTGLIPLHCFKKHLTDFPK